MLSNGQLAIQQVSDCKMYIALSTAKKIHPVDSVIQSSLNNLGQMKSSPHRVPVEMEKTAILKNINGVLNGSLAPVRC